MEHPVPNQTLSTPQPMKLVLIRANGALFHSLAVATLLESQAARSAERVSRFFSQDQDFASWLSSHWLPGKIARARILREYIERTWPEFDFSAALQESGLASPGDGGLGPQRPGAAHEALARCLAAAQGALFYRALSRWTEDPGLRDLASRFAEEETASLRHFRRAYEQGARIERIGLVRAWHTALRFIRASRDSQLPFVFSCLQAHWGPHAPVAEMQYAEFMGRMRRVVWQNGHPGLVERVLFAPWARQPRVRNDDRAGQPGAWFRPALRSA